MRKFVLTGAALVALSAPALAFENFIPMGTGYSTDTDSIAEFGSERAQIGARADLYETEIYRFQRDMAEADSYFRRFQSDAEVTGGDNSIDY